MLSTSERSPASLAYFLACEVPFQIFSSLPLSPRPFFWGPHFIFMYLSAFYKFNMITSNVTDGLLATDWFLIANLAFTDTDITTNLSSGSVSVCLYTLHIYIYI